MNKRKADNVKNRIGERRLMNCGEEAEIVEYNSATDIVVKFVKSGELVKGQYSQFKNGGFKSHFTPTVYGVGIVGLETTKENGKMLQSYRTWFSMLYRCYSEKNQERHPTYKDCSVCKEWLYYPSFKKWFDENYYSIEGQKMALDKDILMKGNKIYSPETCVFVPEAINGLFVKSNAARGNLPIGVNFKKGSGKFQSQCSIFDVKINKPKYKHLGYHNTPEEAFQIYKKAKEENIKQVADYYKNKIPEKLYNAMYNYKVKITD